MADVYRGWDGVLRRPVAVKVFRSAGGPGMGQRSRTEVAVLSGLNHPGLVTVFDGGEDDTDPAAPRAFVVMEFVAGPTLAARIAAGPLPAAEVAALGGQLAAALAVVHARGIVHRDVKPANILLADPGHGAELPRVKLADFGVARLLDETRITSTGITVGTANYLSPEQAAGAPVGPPSDIYTLGLVLLECLTGHPAYPGHGVEAALARLHHPPTIPTHLGPAWTHLLHAMTTHTPTTRPTAEAIAAALDRAVSDPAFQVSTPPDAAADAATGADRDAPEAAVPQSGGGAEASGFAVEFASAELGLDSATADPRSTPVAVELRKRSDPRVVTRLGWHRPAPMLIAASAAVVTLLAVGIAFLASQHRSDATPPAPAGTTASQAVDATSTTAPPSTHRLSRRPAPPAAVVTTGQVAGNAPYIGTNAPVGADPTYVPGSDGPYGTQVAGPVSGPVGATTATSSVSRGGTSSASSAPTAHSSPPSSAPSSPPSSNTGTTTPPSSASTSPSSSSGPPTSSSAASISSAASGSSSAP
jgi:eukaryotic-like serine/threonine-protein kinase